MSVCRESIIKFVSHECYVWFCSLIKISYCKLITVSRHSNQGYVMLKSTDLKVRWKLFALEQAHHYKRPTSKLSICFYSTRLILVYLLCVLVCISVKGCVCNKIISHSIFCLIWFGLLCFYGISTFVGYLIPNPFLYI